MWFKMNDTYIYYSFNIFIKTLKSFYEEMLKKYKMK